MKNILICFFVYTFVTLSYAQNAFGLRPAVFAPTVVGSSAVIPPGFGPGIGALYGLSQAQYYKNWAFLYAVDRLAIADLPQDLQDAADQVLADADVGLGVCSQLPQTAPWQYLRCTLMQLTNSLNQIKAIEREAEARKLASVTVLAGV